MRRLACFFIAVTLLFCGCSKVSYVQYRLVVHAIGIDKGESGGYKVTYQVFSPDKSQGSGGPTDASGSNVSTVVTFGDTLYEAEQNLELQTGRKAFFGNTELILIGSGLTDRKIIEFISCFRESPDMYLGVDVVFASDDAEKTLSTQFPQGNASAQVLRETVDAAVDASCASSARMIEISNALFERGGSLIMPIVTVAVEEKAEGKESGDDKGTSNITCGSFANMLIKDGYPTAIIDRDCAKGIRLLDGTAEAMSFNVTVGEMLAAVRVDSLKIKREIRISPSGYPIVKVSVTGRVTVKDNPDGILLEVVRRAAQEKMLSLCDLAYEKVILENGADSVDISRLLRKYEPEYYLGCEENFEEVVKNTLFEVEIKLKTC